MSDKRAAALHRYNFRNILILRCAHPFAKSANDERCTRESKSGNAIRKEAAIWTLNKIETFLQIAAVLHNKDIVMLAVEVFHNNCDESVDT
jgi:hypothetical protein